MSNIILRLITNVILKIIINIILRSGRNFQRHAFAVSLSWPSAAFLTASTCMSAPTASSKVWDDMLKRLGRMSLGCNHRGCGPLMSSMHSKTCETGSSAASCTADCAGWVSAEGKAELKVVCRNAVKEPRPLPCTSLKRKATPKRLMFMRAVVTEEIDFRHTSACCGRPSSVKRSAWSLASRQKLRRANIRVRVSGLTVQDVCFGV